MNDDHASVCAASASKPRVADYLQVAEWSEEDGCYIGSVPPLVGPSCDGSPRDVAEIFRQLDEIAEEYFKIFEEDGFPVPSPSDAGDLGKRYVDLPGNHLLRCRVLDASQAILGDGVFQNQGDVHRPCFLPLPRAATLDAAACSQARCLRFSVDLNVPIRGLKPLSNGVSFEVLGLQDDVDRDVASPSQADNSAKALHLI